ncbi:sulfopropanediol 3-dehydrogenase [Pedobacter sp. AK017]|uniref:histidinol dehydrogenase n=1 Tax=Pedobacter sp. AK017 TaxID=2723073 RepID=UPI001622E45A|nr:histidinol dehydrogenase [Pedobacter sp. AK017]MBB5438932.1 sulfopropanediol 3-dehydrogenase [Pedobacter sp. AK017]
MVKYFKKGVKTPEKINSNQQVKKTVEEILSQIEKGGDHALRTISRSLDSWSPDNFRLSDLQIAEIIEEVPIGTRKDILFAQEQVRNFAIKQRSTILDLEVETLPGVFLGHKNIPVEDVGCYIPGGRHPMVASSHMSIVTAKVAGVKRVIAFTPPINGAIPKATVCAMHFAGADEIYIAGGVQALAAMAFGTESIKAVDMIAGPGNAYVAEAKRQLFGIVGIDLFAGPTEILVIADDTADAEMVACDLLSQAEHGPTSAAVLITTSEKLAQETVSEIERQLKLLSTAEVAKIAWKDNGQIIIVNSDQEAVIEANSLAYEHVQILTKDPHFYLDNLTNYGALFLGPETNVTFGDKVIGTNHILPTMKAARYTGGLWVGKFLKNCTFQRCVPAASAMIGEYAVRLCELEGFAAHEAQAALRVKRYGHLL